MMADVQLPTWDQYPLTIGEAISFAPPTDQGLCGGVLANILQQTLILQLMYLLGGVAYPLNRLISCYVSLTTF